MWCWLLLGLVLGCRTTGAKPIETGEGVSYTPPAAAAALELREKTLGSEHPYVAVLYGTGS